MSDIIWPEGYVPGFTDNYCSNEVIVTWPDRGRALAPAKYAASVVDLLCQLGKYPLLR